MFMNDDDIQNYTTQDNYKEKEEKTFQPLAPILPLQEGSGEQYSMIRDYHELAKQNFKMLLLTSPGERVMDTNFGVGLKKYLFELEDESVRRRIARDIESQVSEYMPYIRVNSITFPTSSETNLLHIRIKYDIATLGIEEEISFSQPII